MGIRTYCCIIFYCLLSSAQLTFSRPDKKPLLIDTGRVTVIDASPESEKKVFKDPAYNYKKEELKRSRNFIKDFWDWITRNNVPDDNDAENLRDGNDYHESDGGGSGGSYWNNEAVSNFMIVFGIVIVVGTFIYLMVTGKFQRIFAPKPLETPFDFKEIQEDIEGLNIDLLIEEACKSGNYRLATRWGYLKILKTLAVSNKIIWKPYKTNHDYYAELTGMPFLNDFREVSKIYDYVWYGEMPVDESKYITYLPQFNSLEKSIYV